MPPKKKYQSMSANELHLQQLRTVQAKVTNLTQQQSISNIRIRAVEAAVQDVKMELFHKELELDSQRHVAKKEREALQHQVYDLQIQVAGPFPFERLPKELRLMVYYYVFPNHHNSRALVGIDHVQPHDHSLARDKFTSPSPCAQAWVFNFYTTSGWQKPPSCCKQDDGEIRGDSLLALLHTNRLISYEASTVFYRETFFYFRHPLECWKYLTHLSPERSALIQQIAIALFEIPTKEQEDGTQLEIVDTRNYNYIDLNKAFELLATLRSLKTLEIIIPTHARLDALFRSPGTNSLDEPSQLMRYLNVPQGGIFRSLEKVMKVIPKVKVKWLGSISDSFSENERTFNELMYDAYGERAKVGEEDTDDPGLDELDFTDYDYDYDYYA
ncbi:MAG: hypothetical protein M1834_002487 [Cirrosporium novae-zelandiae]|nr:MAG: hypothetical protein M1834_002487 [Cirrosporium novae-zelandiae]